MSTYEKQLGWEQTVVDRRRASMSLPQALAAIVLPMLIQVVCVFIVSAFDPCNNNPGCMAGSITGYVVILLLPASLITLTIATLAESLIVRLGFRAALKINSALALTPFVLVAVLLIAYS